MVKGLLSWHEKSLHPKAKAWNSVIPLNYVLRIIFQVNQFILLDYLLAVMVTVLLVLSALTVQPFIEASTY